MYPVHPVWARIEMEMRVKAALEQAEVRRLLRDGRSVPARQPLSPAVRLLRALGAVLVEWGERLQAPARRLLLDPEDAIHCAEAACTAGASR